MRFWILILISFGFYQSSQASPPRLQIACSVGCDSAVTQSLTAAAKELELNLEVFNLAQDIGRKVDGIIIPGGLDIHPNHYAHWVDENRQKKIFDLYEKFGEYTDESLQRDHFELGWLREYFRNPKFKDLPVLGICYGMQILGVSQGSPMIVDIQAELGIPNRLFLWDIITVLATGQEFRAYEMHHQALDYPFIRSHPERFKNLSVIATSHEGKIIEAIAIKNRPAWGVQFHPELSDPKLNRAIFRTFLKSINNKGGLVLK